MNHLKTTLAAFVKTHKKSLIASLLIAGFVLLANGVFTFGFADPNPLLQRSGLAVSQERGLISGYNTIDPNDGFTTQALGHHAAQEWLRGDIPYWNYYEGIGTPLAGEMQAGAFSPFILLFAFPWGNLLFQILMEIIAGVATYLFLRRLHVKQSIAVVFGIIFALNGTFAWLHNAVFNPVAFLPLLMLGVELAFSRTQKARKGGWVLIAVSLALSLYSGFPETAYLNGLFAGAWALIRLVSLPKPLRLTFFKKLVAGSIIGILLAAPILAAFGSYLLHADIGWHDGSIGDAALTRVGISALFIPYIFGPIFGLSSLTPDLAAFWGSVGGYYTVVVLLFAILGIASKKLSRPLRVFLVLWIVFALLKTFGVDGISDVINLIPAVKNAAFYRYIPPTIAFAFVVLAAVGLSDVLERSPKVKKIVLAVLVVGGIILASIAGALPVLGELSGLFQARVWFGVSVVLAFAFLLLTLLSLTIVRRRFLDVCLYTILIGESLFMFMLPQLSTPSITIDTGPIQFLQQNIGLNRFFTFGPIEPNYGSYYEVASINQNDLPVPKLWSDYLNENIDTNTSALTFTGAYRRDPRGPSVKEEFFAHIDNYRYVGVKFVVAPPPPSVSGIKTDAISDREAAQYGLTKVYTNTKMEIFEISNASDYYQVESGSCHIRSEARDKLIADCAGAASIVRKELYMPGWKATVNGRQTTIMQENEIFQKINLPKGESEVRFSFLPQYAIAGYAAFGLAVILLSLAAIPQTRKWLP